MVLRTRTYAINNKSSLCVHGRHVRPGDRVYVVATLVPQESGDRPQGDLPGDPGRVAIEHGSGNEAARDRCGPPRRVQEGDARCPARRPRPTRIFFAADLHGSEPTFRKFLHAAAFYDVDALVFGGDLMGKAARADRRARTAATARGSPARITSSSATASPRSRRRVERTGFYWQRHGLATSTRPRSPIPLRQHGMFQEAARARLRRVDRAGRGAPRRHRRSPVPDRRERRRAGGARRARGATTASTWSRARGARSSSTASTRWSRSGWSTPTPWDTPREASRGGDRRDDRRRRWRRCPTSARCVFNFHCPPKDTPIDTCLKLEDAADWRRGSCPRPVRSGGRFHYIGGGSAAVREAIERYQPVVGAARPHPRVRRAVPARSDAVLQPGERVRAGGRCRAGSSR